MLPLIRQLLTGLLAALFVAALPASPIPGGTLTGQPVRTEIHWTHDFSRLMRIPSIVTMESSPAHLYVLSAREGLVVFRAGAASDTLQWLYSSPGMEERGNRIEADVRFAYLYGGSSRLTVVEPTSVLGVYSSTELPSEPLSVQRLGNRIYIAMGHQGLGRLSLESPEHLDTRPDMLFGDLLSGRSVIDLASDHSTWLYLLADRNELIILERTDAEGTLSHSRTVRMDRNTEKIFLAQEELIGTSPGGELFLIDTNGRTFVIANVGEPVQKVTVWQESMVIRTESGRLWVVEKRGEPALLWKENPRQGNHIARVGTRLWVSEFDQISPVIRTGAPSEQAGVPLAAGAPSARTADRQPLKIKKIDEVNIPFPRPVILPLELEGGRSTADVSFTVRSSATGMQVRGESLYWQPRSDQIGRNLITIIATSATGEVDSLQVAVNVRPFNTPPRFTPLRPITILVNEEFTMEIRAIDPDGMDPDLIRYLGVDLPEGALLNEETGEFRWRPAVRQAGRTRFQVIATDQFGAAASQEVELRVIEAGTLPESGLPEPSSSPDRTP